MKIGNCLEQLVFMRLYFIGGCLRVEQVEHLQLTDHLLGGHAGFETAAGFGEFCHEGDAGDYGGLFDHHGDEDFAPIDHEILGDTLRQTIESDHVFDHGVGGFYIQPAVFLIGT